jgi:hypothetical protein
MDNLDYSIYPAITEGPSFDFCEVWQELQQAIADNFPAPELCEFRDRLARRQIEKIATAITYHKDLQTQATRELARSGQEPHATRYPWHIKAEIADCDRAMRSRILEAQTFAAQLGWELVGGFDMETGCYQFEIYGSNKERENDVAA